MPNYKFREDQLIAEFTKYIDQTYSGHYGQGGLQSSEVIVDRGHGIGFFLGNVDKYNGRYGKKGEPADHRKDIVKIIHYGFLALYEHDRIHSEETMSEDDCNYAVPGPTNLDEYNVTFDFPREDSIESKLSFEDIEWLNEASVGNEFPNVEKWKKERSLNDVTPEEWNAVGKAFLDKELAK